MNQNGQVKVEDDEDDLYAMVRSLSQFGCEASVVHEQSSRLPRYYRSTAKTPHKHLQRRHLLYQ